MNPKPSPKPSSDARTTDTKAGLIRKATMASLLKKWKNHEKEFQPFMVLESPVQCHEYWMIQKRVVTCLSSGHTIDFRVPRANLSGEEADHLDRDIDFFRTDYKDSTDLGVRYFSVETAKKIKNLVSKTSAANEQICPAWDTRMSLDDDWTVYKSGYSLIISSQNSTNEVSIAFYSDTISTSSLTLGEWLSLLELLPKALAA